MKKVLLVFLLFFVGMQECIFAQDYEKLYNNLEPFGSRLYNDIDPFEDEDSLKYAYNPYPLFRTSAYLYFKDIVIEPGYYNLTPRKLKGDDYILFKQGGKVKFIIPVAKKEMTPLNFYKANIPERKKTRWQKFSTAASNKFYTIAKKSQKIPPPKSFIKVDVDIIYIIVTVYYGEDKYIVLFKRTPY